MSIISAPEDPARLMDKGAFEPQVKGPVTKSEYNRLRGHRLTAFLPGIETAFNCLDAELLWRNNRLCSAELLSGILFQKS